MYRNVESAAGFQKPAEESVLMRTALPKLFSVDFIYIFQCLLRHQVGRDMKLLVGVLQQHVSVAHSVVCDRYTEFKIARSRRQSD